MLPNTLNTNEIKNAAGVEQEFARISQNERTTEFSLISELPAFPVRLKVSHLESGTGLGRRRRSVLRFDETFTGEVDGTNPITASAYVVVDYPVGNMNQTTHQKSVLAYLMSFLASTGADTTIKFDCTGTGAVALLTGGM